MCHHKASSPIGRRIQVDRGGPTTNTTKAAKDEVLSFGQRLAGLRKPAEFTQIEPAAELGVSQRMVANYESPPATPPANLRPQIAAALGVWIAERFGVGAKGPLVKHDGDGRLRRRLPVIVKLDAAEKRQVPQVFRRSMLSSHAGS